MIAPGTIIEALVERLEPYGAWIDCDGTPGLVRIPEIAWSPVRHPAEALSVGQRVRVKVLAVADGQIAASIRAVHPELDPWREPATFALGMTFDAPVALVTPYGCFVELKPGLRALLRRERWPRALKVGDRLGVVVDSIDLEGRKIEVSPLGDH